MPDYYDNQNWEGPIKNELKRPNKGHLFTYIGCANHLRYDGSSVFGKLTFSKYENIKKLETKLKPTKNFLKPFERKTISLEKDNLIWEVELDNVMFRSIFDGLKYRGYIPDEIEDYSHRRELWKEITRKNIDLSKEDYKNLILNLFHPIEKIILQKFNKSMSKKRESRRSTIFDCLF